MSTIGNVTLAGTSPATYTYYPIKSGMDSQWITHSGANALVQARMQMTTSLATVTRPTDRFRLSLAVPLPKTVDGVVSVRSTPRFVGDIIIPDDMTAAEREDFVDQCHSLLYASLIYDAVVGRDIPM